MDLKTEKEKTKKTLRFQARKTKKKNREERVDVENFYWFNNSSFSLCSLIDKYRKYLHLREAQCIFIDGGLPRENNNCTFVSLVVIPFVISST